MKAFTPILLIMVSLGASGASKPAPALPLEPQPESYRLEAGDAIEIRFYFTPELNEKTVIRPDGKISLGLIGEHQAAGKSIPELTSELKTRYEPELREPAITVQVLAFVGRNVFVGGEVMRPGLVELPGKLTVAAAILQSGGLTKTADRKRIVVVRRSDSGEPEMVRLSADRGSEISLATASFQLRPYDVLLVGESRISRMQRAVDQYVFKFIPSQFNLGFSYLLNGRVFF